MSSQQPYERGMNVLIIEDEEAVAGLLSHILGRQGYTCYTAATREKALSLLREVDGIRWVIIDYSTDHVTLEDLLRVLRERHPAVHVIGTSGIDRREEFAAAGVDRFLEKPFAGSDLLGLMDVKDG